MEGRSKKRVLIVDAEPIVRLGVMKLLRSEVTLSLCGEAESLPQARECCIKQKPHVVVLDPAVGDGVGFIKEVGRWSSGCRVVVFTSILDVVTIQRAFKAGVAAYVTKQDPLSSLVAAITGSLAGERHMSPRVESVLLENLARGSMELRDDTEAPLSNREREVLRLLGQGRSTRAIADELRISTKTVETHCHRIKEKLKIEDAAALRKYATLHLVARSEPNGAGNGDSAHDGSDSAGDFDNGPHRTNQ